MKKEAIIERSQKGNLRNVHEKSKEFEHENCLIQQFGLKGTEPNRTELNQTETDRDRFEPD